MRIFFTAVSKPMKRCSGLKRHRRATGWFGRMRVSFLGQFSPSSSSAPLGGIIAARHFNTMRE